MNFLARGDAFNNPLAAKILYALKLIPIYRLSEGKENMSKNTVAFSTSIAALKKGSSVLIFSEGLCENDWQLRTLKKGTARLAWQAWQDHGITDMEVVPLGINYNSYKTMPKYIWMETGKPLLKKDFSDADSALFYQEFNAKLTASLEQLVTIKDDLADIPMPKKKLGFLAMMLLAIPALPMYLINFPLYKAAHHLAWSKTKGTVFYDAVFFAILTFTYPFAAAILACICMGSFSGFG